MTPYEEEILRQKVDEINRTVLSLIMSLSTLVHVRCYWCHDEKDCKPEYVNALDTYTKHTHPYTHYGCSGLRFKMTGIMSI